MAENWEYCQVNFRPDDDHAALVAIKPFDGLLSTPILPLGTERLVNAFFRAICKLGIEGWEMVGFQGSHDIRNEAMSAWFKRPLVGGSLAYNKSILAKLESDPKYRTFPSYGGDES